MDFDLSPRVIELRDRIREFMGEHVYPNEAEALRALDEEVTVESGRAYPEILVEIRERAKAEGLWNLFMPDDEHGVGLTNWEYGVLCEEMGRSPAIAPMAFNCSAPDTGNTEILAEHGTRRAEGRNWLAAAARRRDPLLLFDDRARRRRLRPAHAADAGRARRRRVGDQRPQVVHLGRRRRLARDRDGRHRPRRPSLRPGLDDPRAHRRPGLQPRPPGAGDGPRRRPRPLRDPLRGLPRAGGEPARPAPGRLRDRPGPPRPRAASTTACARSAPASGRSR